jgi:paraquat-inducible protein B
MSVSGDHARSVDELPKARIEKNWKTYLIWLVPLGAAALAGWFIYSNLVKGGPTLHIFFDNAAGLERGKSQLKYRGAQIGEVKDIKLTSDFHQVEITVALDSSAARIAREGSRFWIVKPEVGAQEIRALRTIVSGNYIEVEPGQGAEQTKFHGLPAVPVIGPKDALRVILLSETLGSLKPRSPVFYRGIQVGEAVTCELGHAAQTIETTLEINRRYARLVRMNSKFWNAGGIQVGLNLSGINLAAQSTEALLSGGVAFATPNISEKESPQGTSFRLYDKPENAWLGWAPAIELENNMTKPDEGNPK